MARKTVTLLPGTQHALEKAGANIKKARLRRNIRAELLAERATKKINNGGTNYGKE